MQEQQVTFVLYNNNVYAHAENINNLQLEFFVFKKPHNAEDQIRHVAEFIPLALKQARMRCMQEASLRMITIIEGEYDDVFAQLMKELQDPDKTMWTIGATLIQEKLHKKHCMKFQCLDLSADAINSEGALRSDIIFWLKQKISSPWIQPFCFAFMSRDLRAMVDISGETMQINVRQEEGTILPNSVVSLCYQKIASLKEKMTQDEKLMEVLEPVKEIITVQNIFFQGTVIRVHAVVKDIFHTAETNVTPVVRTTLEKIMASVGQPKEQKKIPIDIRVTFEGEISVGKKKNKALTLSAMDERFLIQIEHLADPVLQFFFLSDDICDNKTLANFCFDVIEKIRDNVEKRLRKKIRLGCLFMCDWEDKTTKEIFHDRQDIINKSNVSLSEYFIQRSTKDNCGTFLPLKEDLTIERLYAMIQNVRTQSIVRWIMGTPETAASIHAYANIMSITYTVPIRDDIDKSKLNAQQLRAQASLCGVFCLKKAKSEQGLELTGTKNIYFISAQERIGAVIKQVAVKDSLIEALGSQS